MLRATKSVVGVTLLLAAAWSTTALAGPTTYTYDTLGRVKTVTRPDGSVTTYTYDNADNRTQKTTQRTDFIAVPIAGKPLIYLAPRN